ncbi:MAG: hypothetical protein Q9218_006711 [Villophora microphyllina]
MDNSQNNIHTVASNGNLGPVFLGVDWAIFSLSSIAVVIRLFTRIWVTRNFGWDDAMMALTQCITAVGKGFVVTEVSYGLGQHRDDILVGHYRNFLKYYYLDTVQFFVALATCKISICLFLLRLSQFNRLRAVLYGLIAFLVFTTVALTLLYALQCHPVHKAWDLGASGACFSRDLVLNITIVQGVFSFVTDFVCAAFPIVLLQSLSVKKQTKYVLCFLMGLGVLTGGVAIARVATSSQAKAYDLSWDAVGLSMTRIFEVNIGNIAACVPLFKPFGRYVRAKISGQDPGEIFYRKSSDMSLQHGHWYSKGFRKWRSRSRSMGDVGESVPHPLPDGAVRMDSFKNEGRSSLPSGFAIARTTGEDYSSSSRYSRGSLGLPLQGIPGYYGDESDIPPLPPMRNVETRRGFHEAYGGSHDTKDAVNMKSNLDITIGIEVEFVVAFQPAQYANASNRAEFDSLVRARIAQSLEQAGLAVNHLHNHAGYEKWTVGSDSSIKAEPENPLSWTGWQFLGVELKSRILSWGRNPRSAFQELEVALQVIQTQFSISVNESCGLHVHVGNGASGFPISTLQLFATIVSIFERQLASIHPPHRVHNVHCRPPSSNFESEDVVENVRMIEHTKNDKELIDMMSRNLDGDRRGFAYNLTDLDKDDAPPTIEFRQHQATLEIKPIAAWTEMVCNLVKKSHEIVQFWIPQHDSLNLIRFLRRIQIYHVADYYEQLYLYDHPVPSGPIRYEPTEVGEEDAVMEEVDYNAEEYALNHETEGEDNNDDGDGDYRLKPGCDLAWLHS